MFPRIAALVLVFLVWAANASAETGVPPSPADILNRRDLDAPFLDAVSLCVPRALDGAIDAVVEQAENGEWENATKALGRWREKLSDHAVAFSALDGVFAARRARTRPDLRRAEAALSTLLQNDDQKTNRGCLRLERARLLVLLGRAPEASAQMRLVERTLDATSPWDRKRRIDIAFQRAEILYRSGRRFDAHLAYRKLASAGDPRLALAARLRLTDLAFDAGKVDQVSTEYESLLPRASAFGASLEGWALRASEAALDARDPVRALRWLERFIGVSRDKDARDVADIRRADLEARLDDPLSARRRLKALVTRRREDPIGVLAAVRSVDLGVYDGEPEEALELLARTVQRERNGLRRYAMGVLMNELAARQAFEPAIAVATKLAFDGVDVLVMPQYGEALDRLLARAVSDGEIECPLLVRALGGRYGILIERASELGAFARLGRCLEEMELAWLALPVYRSIGQRFGAVGAAAVALPLARASLATGDVSLARHMAETALAEHPLDAANWRAIQAEADFREGRLARAVERSREVLDDPKRGAARAVLTLWVARTASRFGKADDARFIAERLPEWLEDAEDEEPNAERVRLLEAALTAAHVLRRAKSFEPAFALYRAVDRHAGAGPLRASARFWLGLARQPDATGEPAWAAVDDGSLAPPWSKVASFEKRFESLRDRYAGVLR